MGWRSGLPDLALFDPYLDLWDLTPDGAVIATHSSRLLPVRKGSETLMLKMALAEEEKLGGVLLAAWADGPFTKVHEQHCDAVLMDRATEASKLSGIAQNGQDIAAGEVLCDVLSGIHATDAPNGLIPLEVRFRELFDAPDLPEFREGRRVASELLAAPQDIRPLHGDMHHGNVLWFGQTGWLAIDPKGLFGERGFDYANIFCNPTPEMALKEGRFGGLLESISVAAELERDRLAQWVVAWTALSALWSMQSGDDPRHALDVGRLASASLRG